VLLPDLLSALLRALSFIAMAQAAGAVLFLVFFGSALTAARSGILRTGTIAAVAGMALLPAHFLLEAGRMAGSLGGVLDGELQRFALSTPAATVLVVRLLALALLLIAVVARRALPAAGLVGAMLLAVSFMLTGHTTSSPERWVLGPLIVLHVLVACFWFGSLLPLIQVTFREPGAVAATVVARFSRSAGIAVPLILIAGIAVAVRVLPAVQSVLSPYGLGLVAKMAAFGLLMALAAHNRWRLGPALARGDPRAQRRFRQVVKAELVIIALVLAGTAVLTMFSSPA
jgi:putative copper export protein